MGEVQRTYLQEFYATVDLSRTIDQLNEVLQEYQTCYNYERIDGFTGYSPSQRYLERLNHTPYSYEVWGQFDPATEKERPRLFGMEWIQISMGPIRLRIDAIYKDSE